MNTKNEFKPHIGDVLSISDEDTVFFGGSVSVVDVDQDKLTCKVRTQPDTDRFRKYVKGGGKVFYLGSLVFVRSGQYLSGCECDNTHEQNDTVCRYCWDALGRRHYNDPEPA